MKGILNLIKKIIKKSEDNPNLSQALARVIFSIILLLTATTLQSSSNLNYSSMQLIVLFHTIYSASMLYLSYKNDTTTFGRKMFNIIADLGALSLVLYTSNIATIFVYPVMLWIIVGNGMRFGTKYLYLSLATGTIFFTLATQYNEAWSIHKEFAISMTIGLIILTLFYSTLIKKIYKLNHTLEEKVKDRTEELKFRFYHDPLTKLKNIEALKLDLEKDPFFSLFLISIDDFKSFNDLYGMEIGNTILKESTKFLKDLYTNNNIELYRVYSDGFVLKNKDNDDNTREELFNLQMKLSLMESTKLNLQLPNINEKLNIDFTIVAIHTKEHALEKANMGLKYARKTNKSYVDFHKNMDDKKEIENILYWKNQIKEAIEEDRIIPVFQPIVDKNGDILKYEALVRLKKGKKLISPYFFLDISIQTKQYEKITSIMIDKSFILMSKIGKDFSINLSFADIKNQLLINQLFRKIQQYNIGSQLIIEIVESEDIEDFIIVETFIKNIRKFGVRVAIDDFGTGYSNYTHILKIMPDYLKIDGSLIKNINTDTNAHKLVESIIFLSHNLGIKTIAEYVHSKEVFDVVKKLDIDEFQGFYFYEPLLQESVEDKILELSY
jgi:EAL domain-containing protein (putative c-di-GMP-specific phosphodiesterase class I)